MTASEEVQLTTAALEELANLTESELVYKDMEFVLTTPLGQWVDCTARSAVESAITAYKAIEGVSHDPAR